MIISHKTHCLGCKQPIGIEAEITADKNVVVVRCKCGYENEFRFAKAPTSAPSPSPSS